MLSATVTEYRAVIGGSVYQVGFWAIPGPTSWRAEFAHLVADGMWARTDSFWWPFFGRSLSGRLPALDHGVAVLVFEELVGGLLVVWCWQRFRLTDKRVRRQFLRTGHLPRDVIG